MFLADYHVHSTLSPDAEDTMSAMARAALTRGISQICFTNHVESCGMNDPVQFLFPPFEQWDEQRAEYEAVCAEFDGLIDIRLGAEVGSLNHLPSVAEDIYNNRSMDFIIGSIHNLRDTDDFYFIDYSKLSSIHEIIEKYLLEYIEIAKLGLCDVLGHIGYMQKYMARQSYIFDFMEYESLLRELFNHIIKRGIGIEVNTSGLHDALGKLIPDISVISLYKECGGEIITVGSDSHKVEHSGFGIHETYDVLRECGFKYVTVYKAHKPEFIKL